MEPGLAAAAYAAETAAEGAVATSVAISRPTAPLQARYRRIPAPTTTLKLSSHSVNVIKDRAYIFGGDDGGAGVRTDAEINQDAMHIVTLPTDLELMDTDYQEVAAVGSGKRLNDGPETEGKLIPGARSGHCATVIGERIYIFGGRGSVAASGASMEKFPPPLEEKGRVYAFDTISKTWDVLEANMEGSSEGMPTPRTYASSSAILHPLLPKPTSDRPAPARSDEAKLESIAAHQGDSLTATEGQDPSGYGTIVVHGGYDANGQLLRDVWAFDVASRVWSRWPDVPTSDVDAGEGRICCIKNRVWRCGDALGTLFHLDVDVDMFDDMGGKGELGVSPNEDGWQTHTPGRQTDSADTVEESWPSKEQSSPLTPSYPPLRNHSALIPTTTGQGRDYLIALMGEDPTTAEPLSDTWSLQIASEKQSAAAIKDSLRSMLGQSTGLEQWAKAHTAETTKDDGPLPLPGRAGGGGGGGLTRFGCSTAEDANFPIVLWGGLQADGQVSGDGWILTLA